MTFFIDLFVGCCFLAETTGSVFLGQRSRVITSTTLSELILNHKLVSQPSLCLCPRAEGQKMLLRSSTFISELSRFLKWNPQVKLPLLPHNHIYCWTKLSNKYRKHLFRPFAKTHEGSGQNSVVSVLCHTLPPSAQNKVCFKNVSAHSRGHHFSSVVFLSVNHLIIRKDGINKYRNYQMESFVMSSTISKERLFTSWWKPVGSTQLYHNDRMTPEPGLQVPL